MSLQGSMSFAALTLFLVLTTVPHHAHASSRGSFGRSLDPTVNGICSSSVIVHGYNCQEHAVRPPNMCTINKWFEWCLEILHQDMIKIVYKVKINEV